MLAALDTLANASASRPSAEAKLRALRVVDEELGASLWRATTDFPRQLSFALVALLQTLNDDDMNIWSLAKEVLTKNIRALLRLYHERIIYELFRGIRQGIAHTPSSADAADLELPSDAGGPAAARLGGRAQRIALELFAAVCHRIKPHKARKFMLALVAVIGGILRPLDASAGEEDVLLLEGLGAHFEPIATHLVPFLSEPEVKQLLALLIARLSLTQAASRRAMATAIAAIARHYPLRGAVLAYVLEQLRALTGAAATDEATLQGALQCHALLVHVAADVRRENRYAADPLLPELRSAVALCARCLSAPPSQNVLVAALEWLHELLALHADDLLRLALPDTARQRAFLGDLLRLLDDAALRVSVRALVLACATALLHAPRLPNAAWSLLTASWSASALSSRVRALLDDADPTLRGHAAAFHGALLRSFCAAPPAAALDDSECRSLASSADVWVPALVEALLNMVAQDRSSIAAKMALSALVACWPALASSRYALWALWALVQLLDAVSPRAFRLVKTDFAAFLARLDWSLVALLASCVHVPAASPPFASCAALLRVPRAVLGSLQSRALETMWTQLYDSDAQVRVAAADALADAVLRLHAPDASALALRRAHAAGTPLAPWTTALAPLSLDAAQLLRVRFGALGDGDCDGAGEDGEGDEEQALPVGRLAFERAFVPVAARDDAALLWLLERVARELERASMADDSACSTMLRAQYRLLRRLTARASVLPLHQLVPTLLDHLEALPAALDPHVHLDLLQLLRALLPQLSGDLARHARRVWLHLVRLVHIVAAVVRHQPRPALADTPASVSGSGVGDAYEPTLAAIQARAQYLRLWERLGDAYRIGRTSFTLEANVFDALVAEAFACLAQCLQCAHTLGTAYVAQWTLELIGYARAALDEQPVAVLRCVAALFALTFTPAHRQAPALAIEPLLVKYARASSDSPTVSPLLAPCSAAVTTRPSLLSAPELWSAVLRELGSGAAPSEMGAALAVPQRRAVLKELEPVVAAAMQRYVSTHDAALQQSIARVLALLVRHEVEFSALDKDQTFFRHVLTQVQGQRGAAYALGPLALLAQLHLERRHLHAVLAPRAFAPLMAQALRGWTRFATTTQFAVSLYALVHALWSTPSASASGEERELRAQMRRDLVRDLSQRLPHPLATQALLFALELAHAAHPALLAAPSAELAAATAQSVCEGVLGLLRASASSSAAAAWKLSALRERDLSALLTLADRLPTAALSLAVVLALFDADAPPLEADAPVSLAHSQPSTSVSTAEHVARSRGLHALPQLLLALRLLQRALEPPQTLPAVACDHICGHIARVLEALPFSEVSTWSHVSLLFDSLSALSALSPVLASALSALLATIAPPLFVRLSSAAALTALSAPLFALVRLLQRLHVHTALSALLPALLEDASAPWHARLLLGAVLRALACSAADAALLSALSSLTAALSDAARAVLAESLAALSAVHVHVRALMVALCSRCDALSDAVRVVAAEFLDQGAGVAAEGVSCALLALGACTPPSSASASVWRAHWDALRLVAHAPHAAHLRALATRAWQTALARAPSDALPATPLFGATAGSAPSDAPAEPPSEEDWVRSVLARQSSGAPWRVRALLRSIVSRGSATASESALWRGLWSSGLLGSSHWRTVLPLLDADAPIVTDALRELSQVASSVAVSASAPLSARVSERSAAAALSALAELSARADCAAALPPLAHRLLLVAHVALAYTSQPRISRARITTLLAAVRALAFAPSTELATLPLSAVDALCNALVALHDSRCGAALTPSLSSSDGRARLVALVTAAASSEVRAEAVQWRRALRALCDALALPLFPAPSEPLSFDFHDDPYALVRSYHALLAAPDVHCPSRVALARHPTRRVLSQEAERVWAALMDVLRATAAERGADDGGDDVAVPPPLRVAALSALLALLRALAAFELEPASFVRVDDLVAVLEAQVVALARRQRPAQLALQHAALFAFAALLGDPARVSDARALSVAAHLQALAATLPEFGEDPLLRPLLLDALAALCAQRSMATLVPALSKLIAGALAADNDDLLHERAAYRALSALSSRPRERADLVRAWPALATTLRTRLSEGPRSLSHSQHIAELTARWLAIAAEVAPAAAVSASAQPPPSVGGKDSAAVSVGEDRVLERIEAVKRMCETLRKSSDVRASTNALVRLLAAFAEEERVSLVFGELTRAAEGSERFVLALAHCGASGDTIAEWLRMSLDHFVHLGALVSQPTALRTLAALFCLASEHPLAPVLVAQLAAPSDTLSNGDLARLFSFAAAQYVQSGSNTGARRGALKKALSRSTSEPYKSVLAALTD